MNIYISIFLRHYYFITKSKKSKYFFSFYKKTRTILDSSEFDIQILLCYLLIIVNIINIEQFVVVEF